MGVLDHQFVKMRQDPNQDLAKQTDDYSNSSITCIICTTPTISTCPACEEGVCVDDMETHQAVEGKCQPWRASVLPSVGRVLVAVRDIQAYEAVLSDTSLAQCPDDSPVCAGCRWPVCKDECSKVEHHQEECNIFQKNKIVPHIDNYDGNHWLYT